MTIATLKHGSNILSEILTWSSDLPAWQRDALRRLVEQGAANSADIEELTLLCKAANGLEVSNLPQLSVIGLGHVPKGATVRRKIALLSIAEPENVNVLDDKQELKFSEKGLTVVFGYNGSGKSGYGRVLRRACRSRKSGPSILGNVLVDTNPPKPASAIVTYAIDGVEQKPEQWVDGMRAVDALGSVSYFDVMCATAHVREKNDIAYTPYGLELLPKLGNICKEVQKRLDDDRKRLENERPKFLQSLHAKSTTRVGCLLKSLTFETDTQQAEELAFLSDKEILRLKDLQQILASDPKRQAQEHRNRARRIGSLQTKIQEASNVLSNEAIQLLVGLAANFALKRETAAAAAIIGFVDDPLKDIGGDVWRGLWESARAYSGIAFPGRPFPVVAGKEALCLLCQQPLGDDAQDRLQRFESFVSDDTAHKASKAETALNDAIKQIEASDLRDNSINELLHDLKLVNPVLQAKTRNAIAQLMKRFRVVKQAAKTGYRSVPLSSELIDVSLELSTTIQTLNAQAEEFDKASAEKERKLMVAELAELKDREWLATVIGDVKEYVHKLVEIHKLGVCLEETRTNRITVKSKTLAKEYVTDQLRDAFATEIKRLQQGVRRLNVELAAAAGEFGSSYYRIQLVGAHTADIGAVVSEGEHQCIALAGFLSELTTEQSQSSIVFDDPVTSLDHHWRDCFARRLAEVAADRQVIVFTHDIVFLHDLLGHAGNSDVPFTLKRLQANREASGIVSDGLPWVAQKTVQRIDELEKQARGARKAYDAQNDDIYPKQICDVYDKLRATIERAIEEWFFKGVVQRHRDYIDLKELRKVTAVSLDHCERLQKLFKKCCDVTGAHDRAPARSYVVPTPDDALADIQELKAVVDELRDLQKAIS